MWLCYSYNYMRHKNNSPNTTLFPSALPGNGASQAPGNGAGGPAAHTHTHTLTLTHTHSRTHVILPGHGAHGAPGNGAGGHRAAPAVRRRPLIYVYDM